MICSIIGNWLIKSRANESRIRQRHRLQNPVKHGKKLRRMLLLFHALPKFLLIKFSGQNGQGFQVRLTAMAIPDREEDYDRHQLVVN
jgi:hypothetical protein